MIRDTKHIAQNLAKTKRSRIVRWSVFLALSMAFWFCLPKPLFTSPTSFVLQDEQEILLSATIAADGQWRFPAMETVPEKFAKCIIAFEDKRFYYHPGVDPVAFARAVYQNIKDKKVVSGGSTLTMQVIRLSRPRSRSIIQKLKEAIQAVRLECSYDKQEILGLYAGNAPFGSNVVGLQAAAWRYYGRSAEKLSWAETATLAVLPNAPSLIHPGKNRELLMAKRNRLLDKLAAQKVIDVNTAELAKSEPLPGQPLALPMLAPHLLNRFKKDFARANKSEAATIVTTTIRLPLQLSVNQLVERYHANYKGNGINNLAAMVMEVETGNVLAYTGNVYHPADAELESHVDVLASWRSPGSTLKPLLYAAAQADGLLLPRQLLADIPTRIGGYTPQNFSLEYDGAVTASQALSRSLNIPAVKLLQQYKYPRFYNVLQQCGFTTLQQPADFYGLSLILGGCEVTPWELAGVYSSLARSYLHQQANNGKMNPADWRMPNYVKVRDDANDKQTSGGAVAKSASATQTTPAPTSFKQEQTAPTAFDFTAVWHTFNAMQEVMRPGEEGLWNLFGSAQRIAWKTGTSFGFRDGWAIGLTPKYCVVVWVGNTDGEGRPNLTGIETAAPVMFDIFRMLPTSAWFQPPAYGFAYLPVCHQSGYKAGAYCEKVDTVLVSAKGTNGKLCPYHRQVHLDASGRYRVTESCLSPSLMQTQNWFVLPPAMEYYYKQRHTDYKILPAFMPGCTNEAVRQMELIYPDNNARIYVPIEITGQPGRTVFTAAHHNPSAQIFWHLDDQFVGTTSRFHQMALYPEPGKHTITIVDEQGETQSRSFEILNTGRH